MLICIVLLAVQDYPSRPRKTVFKLNLPALKHPAKPGRIFNMEDYMQKWKREERRFTQFKLTGDADFDGLTLCAFEYETRKPRSEDGKTRAIKISFNPGCTYGQFVKVCDIMKFEMMPSFAYAGDDVYTWISFE